MLDCVVLKPAHFARNALRIVGASLESVGTWMMSLLACVMLPCLPLIIGALKDGTVENESTLITAAVLAATFIFSASRQIIKALYILLFMSAVLFETIHGQFSQSILNGYAVTLLVAVTLLQAADRFWWHVALTRPFPDY